LVKLNQRGPIQTQEEKGKKQGLPPPRGELPTGQRGVGVSEQSLSGGCAILGEQSHTGQEKGEKGIGGGNAAPAPGITGDIGEWNKRLETGERHQ